MSETFAYPQLKGLYQVIRSTTTSHVNQGGQSYYIVCADWCKVKRECDAHEEQRVSLHYFWCVQVGEVNTGLSSDESIRWMTTELTADEVEIWLKPEHSALSGSLLADRIAEIWTKSTSEKDEIEEKSEDARHAHLSVVPDRSPKSTLDLFVHVTATLQLSLRLQDQLHPSIPMSHVLLKTIPAAVQNERSSSRLAALQERTQQLIKTNHKLLSENTRLKDKQRREALVKAKGGLFSQSLTEAAREAAAGGGVGSAGGDEVASSANQHRGSRRRTGESPDIPGVTRPAKLRPGQLGYAGNSKLMGIVKAKGAEDGFDEDPPSSE